MRKKGFTLVELLVVIAIIALLMGILMPALARVRTIAYRMVCGTNLSGIGKAVLLYAGDFKEEYPMPGCIKMTVLSITGLINDWSNALNGGCPVIYMGDKATIGSVLYLLVKYEDVSVKQFNCKGDTGVKIFKLTDFPLAPGKSLEDFTKAYDFGKRPGIYNSYAYHTPFAATSISPGFPVNSNSPPSAPLAADRNPALDINVKYIVGGTTAGGALPPGTPVEIKTPCDRWVTSGNEYKDPDLLYNSFAHQREGQNVLYNDGSVKFEKQANVGIDADNIWQRQPADKPTKPEREACGFFPQMVSSTSCCVNVFAGAPESVVPRTIGDSLLINEHQNSGALQ